MSNNVDDVLNKLELAITNYVNYCINNEVEPLVSYVKFHDYNVRFYSFEVGVYVSGTVVIEPGTKAISFVLKEDFKWIK